MERFIKYFVLLCAAGLVFSFAWANSIIHYDPIPKTKITQTDRNDNTRTGNVPIKKETHRQIKAANQGQFRIENHGQNLLPSFPPDTVLPYPFQDNNGNPYDYQQNGGLYLQNPSNVHTDVTYDPDNNEYIITDKVGTLDYHPSNYMSFEEYQNYDMDKALQQYWKDKSHSDRSTKGGTGSLFGPIRIGGKTFDRIFGSNTIDIRPSGSAELIFGIISVRNDNPSLDVKQRRNTNFDFQEKIQMNVTAKIGDKIQFGVNYNTEASFEFENKMNLKYEGEEDEIIQLIEAGDVTLPLNSTLITGSQALFGIKTKLKFGRTTFTGIYSQQKSKTENITVAGGAQTSEFSLKADQYEENKHFFISQYFRNHYTDALKKLPVIQSPINITKMEVWITNIGSATQENRNIVAFQDIGEDTPFSTILSSNPSVHYPSNKSNNLFTVVDASQLRNISNVNNYLSNMGFQSGRDFEKIDLARKLNTSEYTYNSKLGFISLNTTMNSDQVLAVAFQYTLVGDTTVYQVGEFSNAGVAAPNCLVVKLLKSSSLSTTMPMWNLMMKNVYAIGGYQINPDDFRLNVLYSGEEKGIPMGYITEGAINGVPLIKVLGCDRLNGNGDPVPDGVFDFINNAATAGGTIQATNGRIFFPVLEPFGSDMRKAITGGDPALNVIADKYCYDALYTMTKTSAQQYPDKNKFSIAGFFKSAAGAEISLGAMNVPQGSVKVTAGGIPLTENVDYTVDYTLGRVKIINEGILNSGTPINISLESNSTFDIQTKTLFGGHIDYMVNKNFNLGATVLNLSEKPLTQKVNFGDEPISNTIWGINGDYQTESRLITKIIDWLPFLETKAVSNVALAGEFAQLIPGHSKAIGKSGTTYIDDFEGTKSSIDLRPYHSWFLASTPQKQPDLFPEGALNTGLAFNYNRAKLAWYTIDPSVFYRGENATPPNITKDDISNHYVREVFETEVFPKKESEYNTVQDIAVLNLAYYPEEKGPYNYDVNASAYSSGLKSDGSGKLKDPASRWGGMMRKLETTDFEATNVEYIEFWMMDPFIYNTSSPGGYLYIDLGDISEDVLRDSRKSAECGLPADGVYDSTIIDQTIWGYVSNQQCLTNSFAQSESREFQDVGLDGLSNSEEVSYFGNYVNDIATSFGAGSPAAINAAADPSSDNYHHFRGPDYDNESKSILQRYKNFDNTDGNSLTNQQAADLYGVDYQMYATTTPDGEDINRDNTLNENERYYQYRIALNPSAMVVGENYLADVYDAPVQLANNSSATTRWYQFKVPIQDPDRIVGGIEDYKSIRFMRMFLQGFSDSVVCRFATLDLVRSEWRRYKFSLLSPGEYIPDDNQNNTTFDVSAVNIEENSNRTPIPYLVPPGIEREINIGGTNLQQMNEQSLDLKVCSLLDGDARAVYKTCDFDMRQFNKLRMFIHAEQRNSSEPLADNDLSVFIRLGTDFTSNYYEYEVPLIVTPWGATIAEDIWPEANNMIINLEDLVNAKKDRNTELRQEGTTLTMYSPYVITVTDDNGYTRKITVVGNPSLSAVKTIMIGIHNPKKTLSGSDDGRMKCAEIWVNELRLTDFKEDGGWAATARINANLADFGNLSLAGTISTPGFGSIDKKVNERQKETIISYDIATNLELGKFFPEKWGLKIPMHYDFSELRSTPQYNPLNPDIIYKEDLKTFDSKQEKDSIRAMTQDYTRRQSLNFMNVRKTKVSGSTKPHIWDVENLDLSYAYTEIFHRNIDIEYDVKKTHRGGLGYNYVANPKAVRPFDKVKFLKSKHLRIIKDFNFYYAPKLLSFRTDLDRQFTENKLRNKTNAIIIIEPTYLKAFTWTRDYGLKWDLTQSLKIDYKANAAARIDEPPGKIDKNDPNYKEKRDSIWNNILDFGRLTTYQQNLDVTYAVPINKLPFMNWITVNAKYGGNYTWTALPLTTDDNDLIIENPLGNVIENSNTQQLNGNINLVTLYNYIPYLKKVNDKMKQQQSQKQQPKSNMPSDTTENKIKWGKEILDNTLSILMCIKSANLSYTENNGKLLPGFMNKPVALGMDWKNNAPGLDFAFGSPSDIWNGGKDIRDLAFANGWMSSDTNLNTPFAIKQTKTLSGQVTIEPLPSLRIDVNANSNYTSVFNEYLRSDGNGGWLPFTPMQTGNFSMSYVTWGTAFKGDNKDNTNKIFERFKEYRIIIAARLAEQNPFSSGTNDTTGYPDGYGPTSQEVLIPAFLAAYKGKDPNKISLKPFSEKLFSSFPLPNWKITYTGLTKIKWIKKYFKSVSISHQYRNTYNVGSYVSSVYYKDGGDGYTYVRDAANNFVSEKEIGQISINEQFSPLIGFDMTMVNSLLIKFEIRKSRNLAMSFSNNQLTDVSSQEYIIGAGYRIKDVSFNIKWGGGRKKNFKSDLNIKADFSIRSNKTVLRKLVENMDQVSAGQKVMSINLSADYQISEKFTIRLFFDKIINSPFVSTNYRNSTTNGGISLKFTLAQ